jgi:hypothetical protein
VVFNTTFNNISIISWQSLLLMEETRVPGENHRPVASHWQIMLYRVHLVVNGIMATQILFSMASLLSFHKPSLYIYYPKHYYAHTGISCSFCVQWVKVRSHCLFCWYWWNCWLSLFKRSLHNITPKQIIIWKTTFFTANMTIKI